MSTELDRLRSGLVEEFGAIYEGYGLNRLKGLVVGLLVAHEEPLSLDDIAGRLGRSKGPISQTVRELALSGIVRKAGGESARRDYYTSDPDLFLHNFRRNMETVRRNRVAAERFLSELAAVPDAPAGVRHHLEHMRAFYALMEGFYARFEEEWARAKPNGRPA